MAALKLGILVLTGLALAACKEEAGSDPSFPPIGGARPVVMPDAGMPTELTPSTPPATTEEASTAALSSAVNEALASTGNTGATEPEPAVVNAAPNSGAALASGNGVLVLADESQAEQERLRNADAAALAAAAAERVVIQPGEMPEVMSGINIIAFARETTNAVGERLYRRPSIRRTISASQCRKFESDDDAQRNFLANGGPQDDPLNLDPNGDGFACRWNPEPFRALVLD